MADANTFAVTEEDEARIVAAIGAAERGSAGEVRVHIEERCPGDDTLGRAAELFERLGMRKTAQDTGVLLYISPGSRRSAVFAGEGVFASRDQGFWQSVSDAVRDGFTSGDGVSGIIAAVERIGELLREHEAGPDDAGNELPDAITTSRGDEPDDVEPTDDEPAADTEADPKADDSDETDEADTPSEGDEPDKGGE